MTSSAATALRNNSIAKSMLLRQAAILENKSNDGLVVVTGVIALFSVVLVFENRWIAAVRVDDIALQVMEDTLKNPPVNEGKSYAAIATFCFTRMNENEGFVIPHLRDQPLVMKSSIISTSKIWLSAD